MITVFADYRARAGSSDEVAAVLAEHVAATRGEPGCVQFVAYRCADDPDRFLLHEQYVDDAAFEAHRNSAHFRRYIAETIVPLLSQRSFARFDEVVAAPR